MIYPILTEFEWGIAGIVGIIILVFGIRSIVREGRKPETKEDNARVKEEFRRHCDEETRKAKEFKAEFEKKWYGKTVTQET